MKENAIVVCLVDLGEEAHPCGVGGAPACVERQLVVRARVEEIRPCGTVLDETRTLNSVVLWET